MGRIIPEKTKAFSASNAVLIRGLGEMAEQAASFVINEMAIATRMTSELALCRTPAAVLGLQSRLATDGMVRAHLLLNRSNWPRWRSARRERW